MKIKSFIYTLLLIITSCYVVAAEQKVADPKYDGIEIVVNINQASAQEIADMLKGIGLKKAQAIVDYREQQGPFESVDDLAKVSGIGEATVAKNEARIKLK